MNRRLHLYSTTRYLTSGSGASPRYARTTCHLCKARFVDLFHFWLYSTNESARTFLTKRAQYRWDISYFRFENGVELQFTTYLHPSAAASNNNVLNTFILVFIIRCYKQNGYSSFARIICSAPKWPPSKRKSWRSDVQRTCSVYHDACCTTQDDRSVPIIDFACLPQDLFTSFLTYDKCYAVALVMFLCDLRCQKTSGRPV